MDAIFGDGATTVDVITVVLAALMTLAGAVGVVASRNPVHSALSLVLTLFGIAVLFVAQEAHFLAAVQVIVYAGAIVVLFLFVIMLLGVDREEDVRDDPLRVQRPITAIVAAVGVLALVGLQLGDALVLTGRSRAGTTEAASAGEGNVQTLAESLFSDHLFAFEVTSLLLVIAVVGAVVLARKQRALRRELDQEGSPA